MKPHHVLILAALLVLGGGMYAAFSAPPEASKITAIVIPSVIALVFLVFAALNFKKQSRGMITAAVVACVMFTALIAFPAFRRTMGMTHYPDASKAWTEAATKDTTLVPRATADRAIRKAFFKELGSPDHDQTYLVVSLWFITGVCAMSGLTLLFQRPASRKKSDYAARA